jgi:hypothetical protein
MQALTASASVGYKGLLMNWFIVHSIKRQGRKAMVFIPLYAAAPGRRTT